MSLYVTPDAAAFRARTSGPTGGQGLLVQGGYLGHLSNLGETVHLFATDGTLLDTLDIPATPSIVQQYLRVTEIHYNPLEQGDETEFLELTNISSTQTLDVSGVSFSDGPQEPYVLPAGTMLSPGQSLVIAANPAALQAAYPQAAATRIFGPYLGNLSNAGERIKLDDASGNTIVDFTYSDGALWPQSADGVGASLVLIDVNTPVDQLDKPNRWRGSTVAGGTPTQAAVPNRGVVINELLSAPIAGGAQQIELKNTSSTTMALAGWSLSDSAANLRKFTFGPGTTLAPGAYLVLSQSEVGFSLDDAGSDDLWLVQTDGNGRPLFFGDDVAFGASVPGEPWGRWPDGPGRLMPLIQPTFGTTNAAPRIGNVVISEVQYHPPEPSAAALALDPTITSADLEFVELTNMQDIPVQLDTWRIRGGIEIDFDPGTLMAEGESVVVLRFNPARPENATRLAAFRAHYGITAEIKLLGGYAGQLSNGMDHVLLQRNATDATEPLWVDEVVYDDVAPWPTAADGNGPSLQRLSPTESGNVASSWFAASPTPGSAVFGQVPGDFNQDGSVNAIDIDLLAAAIRSPSPDPAFDLTGDGLVNVADRDEMVTGILRTSYGDSNLDRLFNSSDLVKVFQAGKYEDGVAGNAGWAEGDWNGDGDFTTADLVLAFQSGGYVAGASRAALVDQAFASLFSL
jgi:hypothetical protein